MSHPSRAFLIFGLLLVSSSPVLAGDTDETAASPPAAAPNPGKLFVKASAHAVCAPFHWKKKEWKVFGWSAMAVGAVAAVDGPVRDAVQRNRNGTTDSIADVFEAFGAAYSFATLGGFYLAGAALHSPRAKATAWDGLGASMAASGIITPAWKLAFGRSRPRQDEGTYHFRSLSGNASFPSGHATQAFAVAAVIVEHYNRPAVKIPVYSVAVMVSLARMDHNAHFVSDVTAGGLMGTMVGRSVVRFSNQERHQLAVVPLAACGSRGMTLDLTF